MNSKKVENGRGKSENSESEGLTRRNFLKTSAAVGGVATAGLATQTMAQSIPDLDIPSIRIPSEIPDTLGEPERVGSFEGRGMTGAEGTGLPRSSFRKTTVSAWKS